MLISSVFLIRFSWDLYKITQKIKNYKKVKHGNATLVLADDKILPHTFCKSIFVNKEDYEVSKIEAELFIDELTHVIQKHTFDILNYRIITNWFLDKATVYIL